MERQPTHRTRSSGTGSGSAARCRTGGRGRAPSGSTHPEPGEHRGEGVHTVVPYSSVKEHLLPRNPALKEGARLGVTS